MKAFNKEVDLRAGEMVVAGTENARAVAGEIAHNRLSNIIPAYLEKIGG